MATSDHNRVENPGSFIAHKYGCTCPMTDNEYGRGYHYMSGHPTFVVSKVCPVHKLKKPAPWWLVPLILVALLGLMALFGLQQ